MRNAISILYSVAHMTTVTMKLLSSYIRERVRWLFPKHTWIGKRFQPVHQLLPRLFCTNCGIFSSMTRREEIAHHPHQTSRCCCSSSTTPAQAVLQSHPAARLGLKEFSCSLRASGLLGLHLMQVSTTSDLLLLPPPPHNLYPSSPPHGRRAAPPLASLLIGFKYIRRLTYWLVSQLRLMCLPSGRPCRPSGLESYFKWAAWRGWRWLEGGGCSCCGGRKRRKDGGGGDYFFVGCFFFLFLPFKRSN